MTRAVTQREIDKSLISLYSNKTMYVRGQHTHIAVFMEDPSIEEYPEKIYPSISIQFLASNEDKAPLESGSDYKESIGYFEEEVPINRMRKKPRDRIFSYTVHAWNKDSAAESRDLHRIAFYETTPIDGVLKVSNVESELVDCDISWNETVSNIVHRDSGEAIYHGIITVRVRAAILQTAENDYEDVKVVTQITWTDYIRDETRENGDADLSERDRKDLSVSINEDSIEDAI